MLKRKQDCGHEKRLEKKKKDKLTNSQVGSLNKYFRKIQQLGTSNKGLVTEIVSEGHEDVNMGIAGDLGN
ncbi:hypothetical protein GIB67_005593 [Kingdonia uniflora]|uniref:Uncharacterized protein n=1 Tax=Kingdonia uniflora TaxID=39325 RepID=A0A7J7NHT4_9MAGN|nr:hypothetical protein GIB67_005593 [Kingdonia uniflora]